MGEWLDGWVRGGGDLSHLCSLPIWDSLFLRETGLSLNPRMMAVPRSDRSNGEKACSKVGLGHPLDVTPRLPGASCVASEPRAFANPSVAWVEQTESVHEYQE